jgi:hypothetical protein
VDLTLRVLRTVWRREVGELGYRAPKSDASSRNDGGNGKLDVYIADIGNPQRGGFYGYCASDDPKLRRRRVRFTDTSAYCVLENDYNAQQFPAPSVSGATALRVTAAHEFFHAVQFAYDIAEDLWFMEGTAVWMEDEVYDDIDDNLQFLADSPLTDPERPLDHVNLNDGSVYQYGNFVWWRYLTERKGARLVRRVWNRADGARGGPGEYSVQALTKVLDAMNTSLPGAFSRFGVANLNLEDSYEEGASYDTKTNGGPQPKKTFQGASSKGWVNWRLDHLSTSYALFEPGTGVPVGNKIRVAVDLPSLWRSPRANLLVERDAGPSNRVGIPLRGNGNGAATVDFGPDVTRVTLVLTNASGRYRCGTQGFGDTTCGGRALDDNLTFAFNARRVRPI